MVKGAVPRSKSKRPTKHRWMYGREGNKVQCGHVRTGSGTHGYLLTRGREGRPCAHCGANREWASFAKDDTFVHREGCQVSDCHQAPCSSCCEDHCLDCTIPIHGQCYCCGGERTVEADRGGKHDAQCEGSCLFL